MNQTEHLSQELERLCTRIESIRRELATRQLELYEGREHSGEPAMTRLAESAQSSAVNDERDILTQSEVKGRADTSYGAYARAIVTARARIENHLDPGLFSDPAFDILLDLLASEEEGRKMTMSGCAYAARVARTTALRWIYRLEEKGLVKRVADSEDQRTTLVQLTADARTSLTRYLEQVVQITRSHEAKMHPRQPSSVA